MSDGLGHHDARRVHGLEDAAQVDPARDLLDEHLVRARARLGLRLRVRECDLLDSTGASRFERSFLCTQRKLISAVPTSPGWGEA